MKLAVTGKGGVGKTTVSALLAKALAARGHQVIAIDADPNSNLAACLGYPGADAIRPLVELKDMIEERTGVKPGTTGGMFRLNPFVADIPDKYAVTADGVKVLVAGAVKKGGSGCYCPENALLRALVSHLVLEKDAALVLDMEAGIEHLSRGTVRGVDHVLVVVEPSRRSTETAERIERLAVDIGLTRLSVIGNKVRMPCDEELIRTLLPGRRFAGFLPFDEAVRRAEVGGRSVWGASDTLGRAVAGLIDVLGGNVPG
jgi:CO dehydrogenase maturation factor